MIGKILESTRYVVENARHVTIDKDAVRRFSNTIKPGDLKHWSQGCPIALPQLKRQEMLNFTFLFDSISFSYWGLPLWTVEYKGQKYQRTWAMVASLVRVVGSDKKIIDFSYLENLKEWKLQNILKGSTEIPLFEQRLKIIKNNARTIIDDYKGSLDNLLKKSDGTALGVVELLADGFPSFNDTARYDEKKVFFYKKAQLFASDTAYFNLWPLTGVDQLTACADYRIPQVLRANNVLAFNKDLAYKVDCGKLIKKGSPQEVEIRACTIWAVELIKQALQPRIPGVTSMQVNDYLWLLGKQPVKGMHPLVRSTFY